MEASAAGIAARGVSLPVSSSSQPSRKQWRAVTEQSGRNSSSEELEHSKLGQSDERLMYEVQQGREPADIDFCSITIDGSLNNDILQQRLHSVAKQREELQQLEMELRAQFIAKTEIMEMQNSFDAQIKEHGNANTKLQEQVHEREQKLLELGRKMEEKERELHIIRLDNEAAWAKEDLLREQSQELQTYRRERDSAEAEKIQHIKQIHDLQEHIQEKDRQFMELQEQNRIAQETIVFKDEQLREAQAWISRVQEMDVFQSSTNQSLQAELRDRTEQYNQLWLGCQRQFGEMERLHLHIQQLQLELADAKERNGTYSDGSHVAQTNAKDASHIGQNNGGQVDVSGNVTPNGSSNSLPNESAENASSFVSGGNAPTQTDQIHGVPLAPSSLLGMPSYLAPGQVTPLHPFILHQQGVPHSVPSHIPQSHITQFHSVPAMSALQQWQNQQAVSEGLENSSHDQYPPQTASTLIGSESNYNYDTSGNGHIIRPEFLKVNISQEMEPNTVVSLSKEAREGIGSIDAGAQSQQSMQQTSSQFHDDLRLNSLENNNKNKMDQEDKNTNHLANSGLEAQGLMTDQPSSAANSLQSEVPNHAVDYNNLTKSASSPAVVPDSFAPNGQKSPGVVGSPAETPLLDERSLLACIVRTIPPGSGGRVRISSTLPNRLGKMLAPLHWHDYKKKYGKLEEFVAGHPELFVIDGDYIQLREGAQGIIAATAAVAKVAAAAATSSRSSLLPSVAVTPMAQSHRLKKSISIESASGNTDNPSLLPQMHNQHLNGVPFNPAGSVSNVKILSKPKDHVEQNGFASRKPVTNFPGKQQGRAIGAATSTRR